MMDKDASFLLFELLYWLGIRSGEALALMPQDFDFKRTACPSPRPTCA